MRNTYYGNLAAASKARASGLFLRGLPMWLLVVGPLDRGARHMRIATVDWGKVDRRSRGRASSASDFIEPARRRRSPTFYAATIVVAIAAVIGQRGHGGDAVSGVPGDDAALVASACASASSRIRSHLRTGQIYGAYLRFLLYGLAVRARRRHRRRRAVAVARRHTRRSAPSSAELDRDRSASLGVVASMSSMMLGYSTIYQGTVKLALWRDGVESLELEGLAVLEQVKAEGAPSSAVGEGLADALNVGGF